MTIVVKIGGGAGIDPEPLLRELAQRQDWVLVHGASAAANQLGEALGHPPRFVTSPSGHVSRFTDARTLDIFAMASGQLNLRIVERLQQLGCNAVGLLGASGRVLEGKRKETVRSLEQGKTVLLRGDHTGAVEGVNGPLLRLLLAHGYAPVVTVPGISHEGVAVNMDADRAAAAIAGALGAEALVILSNVPGLLRDPQDTASLVANLHAGEVEQASRQWARGRFRKKLLGASQALDMGVPRVVLASASPPRPLEAALHGQGTTILASHARPRAHPPEAAP